MERNWKTGMVESVRPEYFFWLAMLGAFLLFLFPKTPLPLTGGVEASAVVVLGQPPMNPYAHLELIAKSAYVYDAKNDTVLFEKNSSEILPLASITKIITAVTALSLVPETTEITIDQEALRTEGDSGLTVGEPWILRDLLTFMLFKSSNDSAVAVSSTIGGFLATSTELSGEIRRLRFIEEMNRRAKAMGLSSTTFLNETGLDLDTERAGAYSSARETARMLAYALENFPEIFKETRWSKLTIQSGGEGRPPSLNTNTETDTIPLLLASKTGYTDLAGGNLVIAFDADFDHTIVISVLGSTADGRFSDVEKLVWATLKYLSQNL